MEMLERTLVAILAGGKGTRFWPISRRMKPKPFIPLLGGKPLLEATIDRVSPPVSPERIHLVLGSDLMDLVREAVPWLKPEQILEEPLARNTLGAVLFAAARGLAAGPETLLAVLPADHYVPSEELFRQDMLRALRLADQGHLVTIGIRPTTPETGYGYIRISDQGVGEGAFRSLRFVEKPDRATAETYLADGGYFWNSGMFFFRVDHFLEELAGIDPLLRELTLEMAGIFAMNPPDLVEQVTPAFSRIPQTSFDYGVMEKASRVAVLPACFEWSDVGAWDTIAALEKSRLGTPDPRTIQVGGMGCSVFRSPSAPLVALVGVEDCVVVASKDAVLVIKRGESQRVREVVDLLDERGFDSFL